MKTVIEMAKEAGFTQPEGETWYEAFPQCIEHFAELVRADEREAVLHLAISHGAPWSFQESIRARSNT